MPTQDNNIPIKEYVDARLKDNELRTEQARVSMEKRLDGMNEFRDALRDQSNKSPTRVEVDTKFDAINKTLKDLETYKAIAQSKASSGMVWLMTSIAIVGLLLSLYNAFLK